MAQTGYTPIQLYYSSTTTNAPLAANLASGELAINITDGKLFYKDNANAVQVIGWKIVPATAGGTGQTSYAIGDLLYADTTTSLAKLADVATGNALISGGVSTAPSWGKIGLATHVSGTLPIANGGTGGTATATSGGIGYGTGSALGYSAAGTSGNVLISGGTGAPTWTGGPTFTAQTAVSMAEVYFELNATSGKRWYLISGGGGAVTSGYLCLYNVTNGNKVMTIAPSTTEQFVTDLSGNFYLQAGNLVIGTSGKGIDFSVTSHPAGMTSELLADYEEGTFTPGSGVGTATSATGYYTKVGRIVCVSCTLTFPVQTNAGLATVTGMPYASATFGSGAIRYTNYGNTFFLYGDVSNTTVGCYDTAGNGITYTAMSGKRLDFVVTYFT